MKTHKVKPILIKSKKPTNIALFPNNKLFWTNSEGIPQELILISLEDEKIEVGDLCNYKKSLFLIKHIIDKRTYLRPNNLKIQGKFIHNMSYCEFTSFTPLKK